MMKKNAALLAGYYGFGNAGDELILASLIEQTRRESPLCEITVLSRNPQETRRRFTVEAVDRWRPWAWIAPMLRSRRFLLGGGGLLQETSGPWNYFYYLGLVALAKLCGCRTELRAMGIDPVRYGFNRFICRVVLNYMVDLVSVRDADSQRALEAAGVRRAILRTADPVFQLTLPPQPEVESDYSSSRIAMAIGPWRSRPGWEQDLALLTDRVQSELGVSVDFIAFYPAEDESICRKAALAMKKPAKVRIWTEPEELLIWMGEYDLVIGMRFHALAIASLREKPFIGWGSQKKVHSLCRDFEQPLWTFERGWDEDATMRQIREAWKHRDTQAHRYHDLLPEYKSSNSRARDVLKIHPVVL